MLIFAHRGDSSRAPANTLKAFDLALEAGTRAMESDVRATLDGKLVFFHDATVKLTGGLKMPVFLVSCSKLQHVDVGAGEHVPLVADVFKYYVDQGKLDDMTWSIDVPGIQPASSMEFPRLAKICDSFGIIKNILACSTGCKILRHWRKVSPSMKFVWSVRTKQLKKLGTSGVISACERCQVDVLNIKLEEATGELVDAARSKNLQVFLWDVHDKVRYDRAVQFLPDAIYSNYPLDAINGSWSA
jgi:glycerophosphoryl diester phosphodiesterase